MQFIEIHDMANGPQPEFTGPFGMAWAVNLPEHQTEAQKATLGAWIIFTPQTHIAWQYHLLTLMHLRDIPGAPPAELTRPDATHQITVLSIDPTFNSQVNPADFNTLRHLLSPPDLEEQAALLTDEWAVDVVRTAIQKCVNGELKPDSDYVNLWRAYLREAEKIE